jgi:thiol:disulfide interchange protein DsbD
LPQFPVESDVNASPAARLLRFCLLLVLGLTGAWANPAMAELKRIGPGSQTSFLRAEDAFQLVPNLAEGGLALEFRVTPGHYLYRDRFQFTPADSGLTVGAPAFSSEGEWKDDPTFGRVRVHHDSVMVTLPASGSGRLRVRWQGCADAGLCYPPQDQVLEVGPGGVSPVATTAAPAAEPVVTPEPTGRFVQLLIMFAAGLALSLTPCTWPMVPIVASIVARQHTRSALRGFLLALAYVLGICLVYGTAGFFVGLLGQQSNLPGWFQHPVVLGGSGALFVVLALSLLGLYELRLPHAVTNHFHALSQRQQGGALAGSFLMGVFSALVVSPCVSAPLVGALVHIGATGDPFFGLLALGLLALGMGVPLLVLGATEGRLLPKSGAWMEEVKTFLGLMLLFVAAELISRTVPPPVTLALYGFCTAALALWLWRLGHLRHGLALLTRALALCGLFYAGALVAGAAAGGDDPLRPLTVMGNQQVARNPTEFVRVRTSADLDRELAVAKQSGKALMLDFYADWCVSCKTMELRVFRKPEVAERLKRLHLVQADVTANNEDDRALLKRFDLLGPPTLVFFDRNGNEISQARLVGEKNAEDFLAHLDQYGL